MIQILALRPRFNSKTGKEQKYTKVVSKNWLAPTHKDLFDNIESYVDSIPKGEQYNVYFTLLNCKQDVGHRAWESQKVIGIDIDGIFDESLIEKIIPIICEVWKIEREKTIIVWSGNGLQFTFELSSAFTDIDTFNRYREHYSILAASTEEALKKAKLPGKCDSSVWSAARLFRLPLTENRKPDKGNKRAYLINRKIEAQDWSFEQIVDKKPGESGSLEKEEFNKNWKADNKAILSGCNFLKNCQENPESVNEPAWYAMLSVVGRMENGSDLAHELSKGHTGYSASETDDKMSQALAASGPRTCKDIDSRWGKCKECPNYGQVKSPILLKSAEHIATEFMGFHIHQNGRLIPQYSDLAKFFDREHPHKSLRDNGLCYVWNGTHYEIWPRPAIHAYAQDHFRPYPDSKKAGEFEKFLARTNVVRREFFSENLNGLINFKNGVLDIKTRELMPHSPERGFMYCLPYAYEPDAKAPRFLQFLDEVTGKDAGLKAVLEEFGGYALSGDEYWLQKTLLLVGAGANGKSAFIDTLKMVAGSENYATASLQDLRNENMRQLLEGKLFNVSPELSRHSLKESEKFKFLSDGSEITVKLMWNQPYKIKNRAKMIFACNDLPESDDASFGFLRRFAIVHFNQVFIKEKQDKFILRKLQRELPGIFNIFLNGYDRLCKQQDFTYSEAMETEKELYAVDNNPIQMFLDASPNIVVHPLNGGPHFTATTELKKAFDEWCLNNGLERAYANMNLVWFGRMFASSVSDGKQRRIRKHVGSEKLSGFTDIQMILDA